MAQRYRSMGIRGQVVVKLKGKRDSNRMDFGNNGITPRQGGIHLSISIISKGVTSSGIRKPFAEHKPRITGNCMGLAMWVQFHVNKMSMQ